MASNGANGNGAVVRSDGRLMNALTGMGGPRDKAIYTEPKPTERFPQNWLDSLVEEWPLGDICRALPEAATSKWCQVTLSDFGDDTQDTLQKFYEYRSRLAAIERDQLDRDDDELNSDASLFDEGLFLANAYHGAALVLAVDDGNPPWLPINLRAIKTIRSVEVLDSYQIIPDLMTAHNPLKCTHYQLFLGPQRDEFQDVLREGIENKGEQTFLRIHKSRVIRLPGVRLTPNSRRFNRGWDGSLLEKVWTAYSRWESAQSHIDNLIADYSLFVYKLSGFAEMITEDGAEIELQKRVASFRLMANALGGIILDKDDEDAQFVTRQFTSLAELANGFRDTLIGASGIPHTILFGESPSGLGATGESEMRTWAMQVKTYQNRIIRPRLRRLYRLIWLAQDGPANGEEPPGWDIEFPPIYESTQQEELSIRQSQASLDQSYKDMGIIAAAEIRASRFKVPGESFAFGYVLDDEEYEKAKAAQEQAQEQAQAPPGAAPPGLPSPPDPKTSQDVLGGSEPEAVSPDDRQDAAPQFLRPHAPYAKLG